VNFVIKAKPKNKPTKKRGFLLGESKYFAYTITELKVKTVKIVSVEAVIDRAITIG